MNDDSGNVEATEDTSVTALGTTATAVSAPPSSPAAPEDANPSNPDRLKPDKFNGGKLKAGIVDATVSTFSP